MLDGQKMDIISFIFIHHEAQTVLKQMEEHLNKLSLDFLSYLNQ